MKKMSVLIVAVLTLVVSALAGVCEAVEVRGRVLSPDGTPVAKARVAIYQYTINIFFVKRNYAVLTTDATGRFKTDLWFVKDNDPHQWIASAYKPGYAITAVWLKEGDNEIKLGKSGQVSGYVVDKQGKGVKDAIIRLTDATAVQGPDTRYHLAGSVLFEPYPKEFINKTDASGKWTLRDLPLVGAGRAELVDPRFVKTTWIYFQTIYPDRAPAYLAIARPAGQLKGRIVFENGKPAAGIRVFAADNAGSPSEPVTTDKNGNYVLTGLATGVQTIMADDPSGLWVADAVLWGATEGKTEKVGRDLVLTKGAIIKGQVTDAETGKPVYGAKVGCWGPSRPHYGQNEVVTYTDHGGNYRLRVSPGESMVYVAGPAVGYIDKCQNADPKPGEVLKVDFRMDKGFSVSGITVDSEGKPVTGASVSVTVGELPHPNSQGYVEIKDWRDFQRSLIGRWNRALSGPDGRFTVSYLKAGKAKIYADRITKESMMGIPESVQYVVPSAEPAKVVMQIVETYRLTGRVVDKAGKPISYVTVWTDHGSGTTNSKGGFAIDYVKKDDEVKFIRIERPGYRYVSGGEVTKKDGKITITDIIAEPEPAGK